MQDNNMQDDSLQDESMQENKFPRGLLSISIS